MRGPFILGGWRGGREPIRRPTIARGHSRRTCTYLRRRACLFRSPRGGLGDLRSLRWRSVLKARRASSNPAFSPCEGPRAVSPRREVTVTPILFIFAWLLSPTDLPNGLGFDGQGRLTGEDPTCPGQLCALDPITHHVSVQWEESSARGVGDEDFIVDVVIRPQFNALSLFWQTVDESADRDFPCCSGLSLDIEASGPTDVITPVIEADSAEVLCNYLSDNTFATFTLVNAIRHGTRTPLGISCPPRANSEARAAITWEAAQGAANAIVWAHEFGHLQGLPDLYPANPAVNDPALQSNFMYYTIDNKAPGNVGTGVYCYECRFLRREGIPYAVSEVADGQCSCETPDAAAPPSQPSVDAALPEPDVTECARDRHCVSLYPNQDKHVCCAGACVDVCNQIAASCGDCTQAVGNRPSALVLTVLALLAASRVPSVRRRRRS